MLCLRSPECTHLLTANLCPLLWSLFNWVLWRMDQSSLFNMCTQLLQYHLLRKLFFIYWIFFAFVKNQMLDSVPLACIFTPTPHCLDCCFLHVLKSGNFGPLSSLFRVLLVILDPVHFIMDFRISLTNSDLLPQNTQTNKTLRLMCVHLIKWKENKIRTNLCIVIDMRVDLFLFFRISVNIWIY